MKGRTFLLGFAMLVFGYGAAVILGAIAVQSDWIESDSYVLRFSKTAIIVLSCAVMFSGLGGRRSDTNE